LYLLGLFRAERDSQPIHFPRRKVEALLTYLVMNPQAHSREKLAALFWCDFTDQQARKSLRTALSILRGELGDNLLLVDRDAVQLNPAFPLWLDVREFEKQAATFLSDASPDPAQVNIQLYEGELLADFYDDWIVPERERLRALYLKTLARLIQHYRAQSEYERAIEFAQKALAIDRADERVYQHLMFCYVASGNRQAALE
jgi:DNA-binding SARP family transcriptional activator